MDTFPITFGLKRRLKDWDKLSASNPPELGGLFTYACNPIVHRVVDDTLNRPRARPVPQYGDIITVRLRCMRSGQRKTNTFHYLSILTTKKMEITAGEPNNEAVDIATRPRHSCCCAIERPFRYK
jgi:hypothetical protein